MKIDDLKLFIKVVELGSFTAAANALDLPRANVSRRIGDLEQSLRRSAFPSHHAQFIADQQRRSLL